MTNGFYKLENNTMLYAPNSVETKTYKMTIATKDDFTYPKDGWSYFETIEGAYAFFGLEWVSEIIDDEEAVTQYVVGLKSTSSKYISTADLSQNEYTELLQIYPLYGVGIAYPLDAVFNYHNQLYKVLQAHTSQEDWIPSSTPALYLKVEPVGVIPVWVQPTGTHDAYSIGAKVYFPTANDFVYQSLINANTYSPTTYPAGWQKL